MTGMKQEAATIIFATIFIIAFVFYLNLGVTKDASIHETATLVDALDEPVENLAEDTDTAPTQPTPEDEQAIAKSDEIDTSSFLDSFNEQNIEEEFEDIQTGIDLLNNPLQ